MSRVTTCEIPYAHATLTLLVDAKRASRIGAALGGLVGAYQKAESLDLAAYCVIVAIGAEKETAEIEEAVYEKGLLTLKDPVMKYLNLLAFGGLDPETDVAA